MTRKTRKKTPSAPLKKRLLLAEWLCRYLGAPSPPDLLRAVGDESRGSEGGESRVCRQLLETKSTTGVIDGVQKISPDDLRRCDAAVAADLEKINRRRQERPIELKYFQCLAALAVEIALEKIAASPNNFAAELNAFAAEFKRNHDRKLPTAKAEDLNTLALWIATGGGKTLLMHLNLLQFRRHKPFFRGESPERILLVTPNERLSRQHIEEFRLSGIDARPFSAAESLCDRDTVAVIEIAKLVDKKNGDGVSVPIEAFGERNLLFVDEGHKGAGGDQFMRRRRAISKSGFAFEYSATFGEATAAAQDPKLIDLYGKAVAFDYSYERFYEDGYGKDFSLLNLDDKSEQATDLLTTGCLLRFLEQRIAFAQGGDAIAPYNIEPPLMLLLGARVSAAGSEIEGFVKFLRRFVAEREWAIEKIRAVLQGDLTDQNDKDIFEEKFESLRARTAEKIREDAMSHIFRAPPSGGELGLLLFRKSKDEEIGLRVGDGECFGLVVIGNAAGFVKRFENVEQTLESPLFARAARPDSPINILVGAKKFIEGWSSWRVSAMGLANVGRSEGSEIIQLFGRGVRLQGRDFSLQRSAAVRAAAVADNETKRRLRALETLDIFSWRAKFMENFRRYLRNEGFDFEPLPVSLWFNESFAPGNGIAAAAESESEAAAAAQSPPAATADLIVPEWDDAAFCPRFALRDDGKTDVVVRRAPRATIIESRRENEGRNDNDEIERRGCGKFLHLLDLDELYFRLLEYKRVKKMAGAQITRAALAAILRNRCRVAALRRHWSGLDYGAAADFCRQAALAALQKYADRLWHGCRQKWERENTRYRRLDVAAKDKDKIRPYIVRLPTDKPDQIKKAHEAIARCTKEKGKGDDRTLPLPRIWFDRHLTSPLLLESKTPTAPPGLQRSEERFVLALRDYVARRPKEIADGNIHLLRNLSRRGFGFAIEGGRSFFPDFVLWLQTAGRQRVVFLDPHGMMHESNPRNPRARLFEHLADLSKRDDARCGDLRIVLDSFILSQTSIADLRRQTDGEWNEKKFAARHILFLDDLECPQKNADAFAKILGFSSPPRANR